METLTDLQANILGVRRDELSVYHIPETPSSLDFEAAALRLIVGQPDPMGSPLSEEAIQELTRMGLAPIKGNYSGGLVLVAEALGHSINSVMQMIHTRIIELEEDQNFLDMFNEYWETRWLAFRSNATASLPLMLMRVTNTLKNIGNLAAPKAIRTTRLDHFIDKYIAESLGRYVLAAVEIPIPDEPFDEWEIVSETNWLMTAQARKQLAADYMVKIKRCPRHKLSALRTEVEMLRPDLLTYQALLVLKGMTPELSRAMVNFNPWEDNDHYEYCIAQVSETDHDRLLQALAARTLGIKHGEEREQRIRIYEDTSAAFAAGLAG